MKPMCLKCIREIGLAPEKPELPKACFATLPSTGQLIRINRGESGYYPYTDKTTGKPPVPPKGMTNDELADYLNSEIGVTKGQKEAMIAGSMFGWDCGGADPSRYTDDGMPIRKPAKESAEVGSKPPIRPDEESSVQHLQKTISDIRNGVIEPGSAAAYYEQESGRPQPKWWDIERCKCGATKPGRRYATQPHEFQCGKCASVK